MYRLKKMLIFFGLYPGKEAVDTVAYSTPGCIKFRRTDIATLPGLCSLGKAKKSTAAPSTMTKKVEKNHLMHKG
jgi:hypothetical protein